MKNIRMFLVAFLAALLVTIGNTPNVSGQIAHAPVTVQGGTDLAKALERAETCEQRLEIMEADAKTHLQDLERMSQDCYDKPYKSWKACEDCGGSKPVRRVKATSSPAVDVCYGEARKVGNSCSCDHMDPLPGTTGKPVPVKMKGPKPWMRTIVCAYTAEDTLKYAMRQEGILNDVCKAGSLLDENADRNEGEKVVAVGDDLEGRCERAGDTLDALKYWAGKLQSDENDVPGLYRNTWETVWKITSKYEDMRRDLDDLRKALKGLCKPKDGETLAEACNRFFNGFSNELNIAQEVNDDQDKKIFDLHSRVSDIENKAEEDASNSEWAFGASLFGVGRSGEGTFNSYGIAGVIEHRSWVSQRSGGFAGVNIGIAETDNVERNWAIIGEGGYLYALNDRRSAVLRLGARIGPEIVPSGTNAVDAQLMVGLQFCSGAICLGPGVAAGESYTVHQYDRLEDRSGFMQWVPSGMIELKGTIRLFDDDESSEAEEPKKKEAPPPKVREERSESESSLYSSERKRIDRSYRE